MKKITYFVNLKYMYFPTGRQALGTTVIRQNYQNSAISTRGINVSAIVNNPVNAQNFYFQALGNGRMVNRVLYYYKKHGLLM